MSNLYSAISQFNKIKDNLCKNVNRLLTTTNIALKVNTGFFG